MLRDGACVFVEVFDELLEEEDVPTVDSPAVCLLSLVLVLVSASASALVSFSFSILTTLW